MELVPSFLPLLGTWAGTQRLAASPGVAATTARAWLVLKLDVAGTVVVQDYRQVRADGGETSGHGVFRAEPGTDAVLWWFFDSGGQVPVPVRGTWRAHVLELEHGTPGGRVRHRLAAAGDRLEHRVERQQGSDPDWRPALVGAYARLSGH